MSLKDSKTEVIDVTQTKLPQLPDLFGQLNFEWPTQTQLKAMLKGNHVVLNPDNYQKRGQLGYSMTSSKSFELHTTDDISEVIAQKERENPGFA